MASPNNTVIVAQAATITDAAGNNWTINNGQVAENGVIDAGTNNVQAIAYEDGLVWQMAIPSWSSTALWWANQPGAPGNYDNWTSGPGTGNSNGTPTSPATASASGTIISLQPGVSAAGNETSDTSPIVDGQGNLWWISQAGQVVENGIPDAGTGSVLEMAYVDGTVWQEADPSWSPVPLWWAKQPGAAGNYDGWTSGPGTGNSNGTQAAPVSVTKTWVGGGTNEASNPADWSPAAVPTPGDTLLMPGGTMNVAGDALQGNTVQFVGNQNGSMPAYDVALNGNMKASFEDDGAGYGAATISINGNLTGSIDAGPYGQGGVTINGAPGAEWTNTSSTVDNVMTVDTSVAGDGNFVVTGAHFNTSTLEFMRSVFSGQSVTVDGGGYSPDQFGTLKIDDLKDFAAPVTLGYGQIILEGLKASSYSYKNDMLQLLDGNGKNVGNLSLTMQTQNGGIAPTDFGVSQVAAGIEIHANGSAYTDGGTLLPMH